MPRQRRRTPYRTRVVHYVQVGPLVVQSASPRVLILGRDAPLLMTRKADALALAQRSGGHPARLTKYRKYRPVEEWWLIP